MIIDIQQLEVIVATPCLLRPIRSAVREAFDADLFQPGDRWAMEYGSGIDWGESGIVRSMIRHERQERHDMIRLLNQG